ncbi:MAG TPA: DUF1800 domain-containing protein [Candidatus Acidoferrales bacterium]|nr:DUF1800 domain-containing protein [Candidatus Acidoferrales bacterium]
MNRVQTSLLCRVLAATLAASLASASPGTSGGGEKKPVTRSDDTQLSRKFKGHLPITELTEDQAILHALDRLGYGPRPGDVERIRQMGLEKWINQQLHPETLDDSALEDRLEEKYATLRMSSKELAERFPTVAETAKREGETKQEAAEQLQEKRRAALAQMAQGVDASSSSKPEMALAKMQGPGRLIADLSMAKLDRAIFSQRQLEAVMEDFWFNHFNVFAGKGADRWLLTSYVRDTIRPHTMGKFQDLLMATAKSPAMLFFLDNWLSVDPMAFQQSREQAALGHQRFQGMFVGGLAADPRTFPAPDGRTPNQRPKRQERGLNENYGREVMELHTVGVDAGYTQQDVIEMAKCLTGWTVREPRRDPAYVFKPEFHAAGEKVVMGHTFDYGDERDGEEALKMLANDPHTARFLSTELARHFVSDNPPATLVNRMAANYQQTGGDIRSVLHTMIYSPEFWSKQAYRAKVKTPFELVASTARALNADVGLSLPLELWVARMGEPLFLCQPPTGYSDKASTWVNTGALLNRLNFALAFASGKMPGTTVNLQPMFGQGAATDPELALTRSVELFLGGQVDTSTRQTLEARLGDPPVRQASLDDPVEQVNEGLLAGLVLGTPEFQRR